VLKKTFLEDTDEN